MPRSRTSKRPLAELKDAGFTMIPPLHVASAEALFGEVGGIPVSGGGVNDSGQRLLYAPQWAQLIAVVEPVNERARVQVMRRARDEVNIRDAILTVYGLAWSPPDAVNHEKWLDKRKNAYRKVADFIMSLWDPEKP